MHNYRRFLWIGLLPLLVMLISAAHGQAIQVTGKIIDSVTQQPVPDASVFLVNTTQGTKTDAEGRYSFARIPAGPAGFIISCIGYQTKQVDLATTSANIVLNVLLKPKTIQLKEVTISSKNDWEHNLKLFKQEFIGTNNDAECRIVNPDILNLSFDNDRKRLSANTDDFLDIENKILGYKLRFLVKDFWADYTTGKVHYAGKVIFEEMAGSKSTTRKWIKNRALVYSGSFRQFLTVLANKDLAKSSFVAKRMHRQPNPEWKADSIRLAQDRTANQRFRNTGGSVVVRTFRPSVPKTLETLDKSPLYEPELVTAEAEPGTFKFAFKGYLYVIYKNKKVYTDTDDLYRQPEADDYQIAALSLKDPNKPLVFTTNGLLLTMEGAQYEGAWNSRIVDLLPNDYMPAGK
ncbi:MAG: carboxypeptidase-like regulatory domain-containing protein [Mucilaginibacter sp.]